ncbi:MAG: NAD-dependent epimerase/dehydratase family protein [Gammaproteobacteria bacterium]|nr:NAD-dependent epimerase/dehydratase family protein [Gammaproteobacteria bacterium]
MKVMITGGGGYLGGAIVKALEARGDKIVSLQRGNYPGLKRPGITVIQGDMTDQATVDQASEGCDVIYHVAGLTGVWGKYQDYYHINVTGTECILNTCRTNGIKKLVYTSSPSVIFDGSDEENVDESIPYPETYFNHYQRTKSTAEQMVLAANGSELAVVALRPHLIWGPGDPHLVGRILERARKGKLKLVSGKHNLVDTTYIDNAAQAHLQACEQLAIGSPCSGKAYFITNGEPRVMSDIINGILKAHDMPEVTSTVPASLLYTIGTLSEWLYSILNIKNEPMMTRFIARQLSSAHWYNLDAARRDLGYEPKISIHEGMQLLKQAYQESK